jgi:hypothetical protein
MGDKKYLLVKGAAGLGNRLFGLLSAILYARLCGRRLLVDWSDDVYSSDGSNAIHRLFRSPWFSPSDEIPETDSVRPSIWRGRLQTSARELTLATTPLLLRDPRVYKRTSIDISRLDYEEEVLVFWAYHPLVHQLRRHFRGDFASLRSQDTDTILRQLMSEGLELHPAIQERVHGIRERWPAGPTLGIHVRYTDLKTNLRGALDKMRALTGKHPGLQVFLATDNREIEALFRRDCPGLLTAKKWYPDAGARMHSSLSCPDKTAHAVEALTDLYLLAGCDHLIVDRSSSFSYFASLLADRARSQIHDVHRLRLIPAPLRWLGWLAWMSVLRGPRRLASFRQSGSTQRSR